MYKCIIFARRNVVWGLGLQLFSRKCARARPFCRPEVAISESEAGGGLTHLIVVAALDDMHQSKKLFQVVRCFVLIDLGNERFDGAA